MASISNQNFGVSYNPKGCFACLAGFLVDMIVLTFPPALGNVEWRVGFLQQLGDRSIILLLGLALIMYSWIDIRPWRRKLALACLIIGVVFNLSSVLAIRDNLKVQEMAITNISTQAPVTNTDSKSAV